MNTRLLVYRMSKSVQQPISARSVEIFCVQARKKQRNREKIGWDWLYGEKYPLVRSWRNVGRYGGRNHVCNIWWLSVKGCGFGKGVILPSPIDLRYRPYNTINACFPRLHNWQDVHAALQQSSSGHTCWCQGTPKPFKSHLLISRYARTSPSPQTSHHLCVRAVSIDLLNSSAILKTNKTSVFRRGRPDFNAIWQADAEQHADHGDMIVSVVLKLAAVAA